MAALELKIPPAILLIFAMIGVYYSPVLFPFIPNYLLYPEVRSIASGVLLALGAATAILGVVTFKMARTTTNPVSIGNVSSLVTHGIYRFTRNPMYLGMLFIIVSFLVKFGHSAGLIFVIAFIVYMNIFQIRPEERMLTQMFGDQYKDYLRHTRSWL